MTKLKRYTNFEELKSDIQPKRESPSNVRKEQFEFEAFIDMLKRELSKKKKNLATYGKQPG